jgi:hypothetical protein
MYLFELGEYYMFDAILGKLVAAVRIVTYTLWLASEATGGVA